MDDSSFRKEWKSDREFLIGRNSSYLTRWIGGCPYGTTLSAWSLELKCEIIMLLPCKRWGCSHCGVVRAADLARRISLAAPNKFITLTVANANFATPREAYDETRRRLPKWSAKVRKAIGSFEYIRILEVTEKGYPHYHLLARCGYIPQATISTMWAGLTGSPIVDIRQIRPGQGSINYVCKYLKKQKYCSFTTRRVSWTKGFFKPEPKSDKVPWRLINKRHILRDPATVMTQEWGTIPIYRIGPYAFADWDITKQAVGVANEPPPQLVY